MATIVIMSAGDLEQDNPISDLLVQGIHRFPPEMEALILQIAALDFSALDLLDDEPTQWSQGKDIDQGMILLKQVLERVEKETGADSDDLHSFGEAFG